MLLASEMSEEEHRFAEEGLDDEQQLAVYDMLRKPNLAKSDMKKIKSVSAELLKELMGYLETVQDTFSKQSTSDAFRQKIYDYLYDDTTGLPESAYTEDDIETLTESVYQYFNLRSHDNHLLTLKC